VRKYSGLCSKSLCGTRREYWQARQSRVLNVLYDAVHEVRSSVVALCHEIIMSISNNAVHSSRPMTIIPTAPVNILADRLLSRKRKRDGEDPTTKAPSRPTKPIARANVPLHKAFSDSRLPPPGKPSLAPSPPQSFVVKVRSVLQA
jgi:hypothetical protein